MPEISEDATILIAISWQALIRAKQGDLHTMVCDCTVAIVFAAYFIEANLNYLLVEMEKNEEMKKFVNNNYPGLRDKLAWFYNCFIARHKASTIKQLNSTNIDRKLRRKFPGFNTIHKFRNDVSHGVINPSIANLSYADDLRRQAKYIVDELFRIAEKANFKITREVTYYDTIRSIFNFTRDFGFNPTESINSFDLSS